MKVPLGIDDFKKVRDNGYDYVDKTALIDSILATASEAYLFTRPRRFGKSLNLSMLDAYFNQKYRGNKWFDGLKISDLRRDDPEKNHYPIVYLSLKDISCESLDSCIQYFRGEMARLYSQYSLGATLLTRPVMRRQYRSIIHKYSDIDDLTSALSNLCAMLEIKYRRKVIVLIDEYDSVINRAYGSEDERKILDFIKAVLSPTLKGNSALRFAVVTGVMRISKESIFSGLNNLVVSDIFGTEMSEYRYGEMFGFTEEEVKSLCLKAGHPEKFEEAKEWYDGYCFAGADIYNPWSVLNYIGSGFNAEPYWAGTSGNDIIERYLKVIGIDSLQDLETLSSGGFIEYPMKREATFEDIHRDAGTMYSVLATSGYLRAKRVQSGSVSYHLSIPNKELFGVFAHDILERVGAPMNRRVESFYIALTTGDVGEISQALTDMLTTLMDPKILDHEHSYQTFVIGLLARFEGNVAITSEGRGGSGYYDLKMTGERIPTIIIEFKRRGKGDPSLDHLAQAGLDQIHERDYCHGITGEVLLYGMAFEGQNSSVKMERLTLS